MPSRVGVHLEPFRRGGILTSLQLFGSQSRDLIMGSGEIIHIEIEVDLLRRPVGPIRRNMVRCQLYPHFGLTVDDHRVPVVIRVDGTAQHTGPERTHSSQVGRVEDDD